MALVVKDRVKVYSSTTGTGTLSLGSAFAGFQTFNNALGDGDTTYYGIFESSTGNWEVGLGTYTSSGNTLSRDTILESSNAGAAVNLTADTEVFITYPAEKSVYFDANGDVNLTRDPQSSLQAATKQYVDTIAAAGLHYHAPVRVEEPSNLTVTYDNGTSGVGATLTNAGTQAALVLDNVTMVVSDRVLIANQTNQAHNGVYTVTNIGSASTNWVLTRATDADSYGPSDPDALGEGDAFFIKEGDTNAGHLDVMTTSGEIVFGTTNIVFSEVAETTVYSAGDGLTLSGTEFNVGAGTGITVNATTVSTVQDIATSATPTFDGLNTTGNITFGDNDKAIFGAGSDLQIYHDGSNSYMLEGGTGSLILGGTNLYLANGDNSKAFLRGTNNADVALYYNNSIKLTTTSTGVDITGTLTSDGLTVVDGNNTIDSSDANSYPRITTANSNAQLGLFRSGTSAGGGYLGANADASLLVLDSSFTERMRIDSSGNILLKTLGAALQWNNGYQTITGQSTANDLTYRTYQSHIFKNTTSASSTTDGTEVMRIDSSGNVGIGVVPDTWASTGKAIQLGGTGHVATANQYAYFGSNYYYNSGWKYTTSSTAAQYRQDSGSHQWLTASSGTADAALTWSEAMRIDSSGRVMIGTTAAGVGGADEFTVAGSGATGITIRSGTTSNSNLYFADGTSGNAQYRGYVYYKHDIDALGLGVSGFEAVRIDSSGNVGIGTTSPSDMNAAAYRLVVGDGSGDEGLTIYSGTANNGAIHFADGISGTEEYRGWIQYQHSTEAMRFGTSSTEAMRIDSSGNVIINGTVEGSTGFADTLTVSNTAGNGGMTIRSANTSVGSIFFSDVNANSGSGAYAGFLQYSHAVDAMLLGTGSTERMRIDSSGNLLVGKTSTNTINTVGHDLTDHGEVMHTTDGGTTMYLNRKTSDGTIIDLRKDSTVVGSIASRGGVVSSIVLDPRTGGGGLGATGPGSLCDTTNTGASTTDNVLDLGHSGARWKDLYVGGSLSDGTTSRTVADIVGLTSSQFLRSDASDTYTSGTLTFGSGTGLNMSENDAYASMRVIRNANTTSTGLFLGYGNGGSGNTILYGGGSTSATATVTNTGIITYGDFTIDKNTPRIDFQADQSGSNVGGRIELNENGNLWVNAQGGKTLWLNWYAPNTSSSYADLAVGDGNQGSYIFNVDGSARSANVSGTFGVSGILHTSGGSSGGVRIGANSSGYPLLTTVNGVELVIRDTDQIRFSDSTSWDYSAWAGIRYEAGSNLMTIGGPSSSKFSSNAGPPDITINFDGLSGSDGLTYEGNPIWHDGNTATVIDQTTDITNQDWNTYIDGTEASWARVANMTGSNRPPNYTYGTALSISMSGSNKFQLYASHTGSAGDGLFFRTGWNTDYRGWAKIFDNIAHPALGYVDVATDNYGTIKVDDDRGVSWAGYAIRDDWVFMSNGPGAAGIYNDTDNEWAIYFAQNAATYLYHNGSNKFETTSGGVAVQGALTATGDITAYFSDERLKDFDGKIEGALDKVSQLNGYYYHENDKAKELGFENDARQVGVSAQEVEAVLPEVIKPAPVDPEYKTVQYEKLVPLLIEAIKELKEEVRQLKEDKA